MTTYEQVHAGAVVLGHDNQVWGVEAIAYGPPLMVTLVRYGRRVTGYPPAGTPVTVVSEPDLTAEFRAAEALIAAGLQIEIIEERV